MKMKRLMSVAASAMAVALVLPLAGCDWTSNTDGGFSSRYNFLNFSGVYRGVNGGLLVTDYSSEITTPDSEGSVGSTNNVTFEVLAKGNGSSTKFSGRLDQNNVIRGSISITAVGFTFTDADGNGTLLDSGDSGAFGNINYDTGQWTLDFNNNALANGADIVASYKYFIEAEPTTPSKGTGSGPLGNATSGTTGAKIFAFTVEHFGNRITVIDNNGKEYRGSFGDIRTTSGVNQDNFGSDAQTISAGDSFIGTYSVEGISAAGKKVTMVGTFQGIIQSAIEGRATLDDRLMLGTWIEENGRTGNINGESSPIAITIPTTTTTTGGGGGGT